MRKPFMFGGLAVAMSLALSGTASAQNCNVTAFAGPNGGAAAPIGPGAALLGQIASATASQISASTSNTNTVFQAGQGSAFVSAPANPPPDSPGGGVWGRGTGGQVTITGSSTTQTLNQSPGAGLNQTSTVECGNATRQTYSGFQIGADTARLNWGGWNLHLGTTAGYLESNSASQNNAFTSNFQVPFVGTYAVATYGRFFADGLIRQDFYNVSLDNPGLGFFNQPISGTGTSVAVNVGYNFALANNFFIEPSAGFTYSRTRFDSFTASGAPGGFGAQGANISGTVKVDDVTSEIGRASLRIGTNVQAGNLSLTPFFTASVYHDFAGAISSSFATCANCNFFAGQPASFTSNTLTSRVGTYGQYSLGVSGQIINTGWLGFARFDYRNGQNIDGYAGTAGIRYQFTPEFIRAVMPTKAPVKAFAISRPVNWTGGFIGVHGGAGYEKDRIAFVGSTEYADTHHAGVLGGGQIGYNYQLPNKFVLGIEGDISWADVKGGKTCGDANGLNAGGVPGGFSPYFMTCNTKIDWMASATAKIGYAWGDRTLYYLKGGAAFANETASANCILGPFNVAGNGRTCNNQAGALVNAISMSDIRVGWTLGAGAEFALSDRWSAKAEYTYAGFGTRTALASDATTTLSSRLDVQTTKIGVNYRFGAGPLVAKY